MISNRKKRKIASAITACALLGGIFSPLSMNNSVSAATVKQVVTGSTSCLGGTQCGQTGTSCNSSLGDLASIIQSCKDSVQSCTTGNCATGSSKTSSCTSGTCATGSSKTSSCTSGNCATGSSKTSSCTSGTCKVVINKTAGCTTGSSKSSSCTTGNCKTTTGKTSSCTTGKCTTKSSTKSTAKSSSKSTAKSTTKTSTKKNSSSSSKVNNSKTDSSTTKSTTAKSTTTKSTTSDSSNTVTNKTEAAKTDSSKTETSDTKTATQENGTLTEEEVYQSIIKMKDQYPEGMRWTNSDYYRWKGGIIPNGYGCVAFAYILSDEAFGSLPARQHTDVSSIRVGDILRINQDTHSVIVLEVNDEKVVIAEGNYNSSIHWGRTFDRKTLEKSINYIYTRYPN